MDARAGRETAQGRGSLHPADGWGRLLRCDSLRVVARARYPEMPFARCVCDGSADGFGNRLGAASGAGVPRSVGRRGTPAGCSAFTAAERAIGPDRAAGGHCGRIGLASGDDLSAGRASVARGCRGPPVRGSGWSFPSERCAGIGESSGSMNRRILAIRTAAQVLPRSRPDALRS